MSKIDINEQVNVTAMGFKKNLVAYPRRMEYKGVTYDFVDSGLRCKIRHGGIIAEVITLSDGIANYFLRTSNSGNNWTLLGIAS
jgi:hypothetical protein